MQVNPTNNAGFVPNTRDWPAARQVGHQPAEAAFAQTESLNRALQQIPEVREAEVARGKALVEHASYPPVETLRRIATLLALNLDREGA